MPLMILHYTLWTCFYWTVSPLACREPQLSSGDTVPVRNNNPFESGVDFSVVLYYCFLEVPLLFKSWPLRLLVSDHSALLLLLIFICRPLYTIQTPRPPFTEDTGTPSHDLPPDIDVYCNLRIFQYPWRHTLHQPSLIIFVIPYLKYFQFQSLFRKQRCV